jgi:predicted GTPase
MANKRVLLNKEDFQKLTKGEIITKDGVDIALSDIGYHYMIEIIRNNWKSL